MTIKIKMHPRPMKRHSKHVEDASADVSARMPGEHPYPGLHIRLYPADGGLQTVIVPIDQLDELSCAIEALHAA